MKPEDDFCTPMTVSLSIHIICNNSTSKLTRVRLLVLLVVSCVKNDSIPVGDMDCHSLVEFL